MEAGNLTISVNITDKINFTLQFIKQSPTLSFSNSPPMACKLVQCVHWSYCLVPGFLEIGGACG